MRPLLPVSLAAVIAASVVFPAQAAQPQCLTSEIESELIDSRLALGAGQCHLEAMAANPSQALAHAQYAYSWFVQAEQRQAGSAVDQLTLARQRLEALERQGRVPALTAQNGH
ncbi:hypothetical protein HNP49_002630 [Pseudomonas fluvialis]|uniref:DUF1311 domain-containing protein n=1 Tax=Pseudomonas fluvialis TaxID=1793966 RepID=A0A7X0BTV3_9PSED|nr:hypothetical protein [Pseudomonas fluvialis]MBB6342448.1 hypothetical protein [Pseudomonas fluvialis]